MFDLTGRTALVTGASGGIGSAIVKALDSLGASIILSGRNQASLEEIASTLQNKSYIVTCDLSDTDSIITMAKQAEEMAGKIDILLNNAGTTKDILLLRMKEEDWDTIQNINLKSAFMLSKAVLKGMMSRRFGRIISLSSVVGITGNVGQANYAASKAGLVAFSKSLAQEVASRNITVNCIAPGFIQTAMTEKIPDEYKQEIAKKIPVGRFGKPEDVASLACFLASDEAGYITGQQISVNGGMI